MEFSSGKIVRSFEGHSHHVLGVDWKHDGRTLVSSGADNVIKAWDFTTGERRKTIEGFGKEVTSVHYLGDADQILATSGDATVRVLTDTGNNVRQLPGASDFMDCAAASFDGKLAIAGGQDGVLRVWNAADGKAVLTLPEGKK
jgi:WD40 repeat protein